MSSNEHANDAPNGSRKELPETKQPDGEHHDASNPPSKTLLSRVKQLWGKTGITLRVYESMFKGALAPTIAIASFQATSWANHYTTLGYLVGIMTVLSTVIQPRAKFVQTMLMQILLVCIGSAITMLAFFCCVQARISSEGSNGPGTGGPGTSGLASKGAETSTYNASASAVAGVWLFAEIYTISVLRARMPQYTVPCIMWAVFANVSMTYAPQFSTMGQATSLVLSLLEAYLTAFGIATGVSLLVFPLTSRHLVRNDIESFISGFRSALKANMVYLESLEETDMFAAQRTNTAGEKPPRSPEADAFIKKMDALTAIQAKFATDLPFAKREVAIGRLGPDDLQEIFRLIRGCIIPALGLSCMSDIFERTSQDAGWDRSVSFATASVTEAANDAEKARIESINEWHELMKLLKAPFSSVTDVIDEGLQHIAFTLGITKREKGKVTKDDAEASGDSPKPGDKTFAAYYYRRIEEFQKSKELMLRGWCSIHHIELPDDFFSNPQTKDFDAPNWVNVGHFTEARKTLRRQLMVVLYIEFLLYSISRRVYELVNLSDRLRDSEKLSRRRLVLPGYKRCRKWIYSSLFLEQDADADDVMDVNESSAKVTLGQAYKRRKDPEHLPAQNAWERYTDQLRKIAHFFDSPASKFGFRVAIATLSIAIINYMEDTQVFFTTQRLFWAQIMTSIGMSPSAGQSLRTFMLRITGTFMAMLLAYIAYYIVDGEAAGVLVFYFIFLHIGVYVVIKHPTIAPVGIIGQVTMTLILGYQLQVRKIGIEVATSNGQAYYPVWELGLTRLATVVGGLFVAWIFTILPYPITEHSQLRKNLGSSLYLLANYYSVVHETVQIRLAGAEGDMSEKGSPGRRLEKVRHKLFSKCNVLLSGLRTQSSFVKFDIPVGGKFPTEQYKAILSNLQNVLNFMSLISVASIPFSELSETNDQHYGSKWLRNFRKIIGEAKLTSQSVTTLLSLLSSAVANGNPLPPYVRVPEPYQLSERLEQLDKDILSVRHIAEPGYASFAVIQIGTKSLIDDLKKLLESVKELVGELDFSYHIISTADASKNDSQETLTYTKTHSNDQSRSKEE